MSLVLQRLLSLFTIDAPPGKSNAKNLQPYRIGAVYKVCMYMYVLGPGVVKGTCTSGDPESLHLVAEASSLAR